MAALPHQLEAGTFHLSCTLLLLASLAASCMHELRLAVCDQVRLSTVMELIAVISQNNQSAGPAESSHCGSKKRPDCKVGNRTKRPSQEMSRKSELACSTRPNPWFSMVMSPILSVSAATVPATWPVPYITMKGPQL